MEEFMKKKIFKKNRLVILALSVMIGVAGYLNFNAGKEEDQLRHSDTTGNTADIEVVSYNNDTSSEDNQEDNQEDSLEDSSYIEQAALEENVELNGDEEDIGEAVLTNAEVASSDVSLTNAEAVKNNMATAKLNREQSRSRSKEALLDIINDETLDEATKENAISSYVALADNIEKETDTETLLTAKGYTDCIVTISDNAVDVALMTEELSDTERACIEDIVTRKTGYDISQVVISLAYNK
jgi:stage III sporulation protein AH